MTIVRSLGVTTLVALMSAHRATIGRCDGTGASFFDQATVDAIEDYLRSRTEASEARPERPTRRQSQLSPGGHIVAGSGTGPRRP
jgi:hypothetical protein